VLDEKGELVGHVSLRDLLRGEGSTVAKRMTHPAITVSARASIEEGGRTLARTGRHRLVVVDEAGKAVGIVSALDLVRGLLGEAVPHPAEFPHLDPSTGVTWTDQLELDMDHAGAAPSTPGLLVLLRGARQAHDRVVWVEAANNVQSRIIDLLSTPQDDTPALARWLESGGLRFRAAMVLDAETREQVLARLRSELTSRAAPGLRF
jgi:CBS domain-containing protein